jgi:hypothetical protein
MTDEHWRFAMRNIDELIAQGYEQTSRKYRIVARLPPGKTGLEALAEVDPGLAANILRNANEQAAQQFRRVHAQGEDQLTLTWGEFNEFLVKTGKGPMPLEKIKELAIANGTYDPAWDLARTGRFPASQENHAAEPKAEK